MTETYEEIVRRNEPKNYTVKWRMADGTTDTATYFESFEEASLFADTVKVYDYVENVQVLRAGRHPSAKRWTPTRREAKPNKAFRDYGVTVNEDAWNLPTGYVDGDADKHGPVEMPSLINRVPARTNAEKAEWTRNNKFDTKTCLWQ